MTGSPVAPAASIGACLTCRQVVLVTPDSPNCLLCGRPPALTLPFSVAQPTVQEVPPPPVEDFAPAEEPVYIGITCPHCEQNVQLALTPDNIAVVPPAAPSPSPEPAPAAATPAEAGSAPPPEPPSPPSPHAT